MPSSLITWYLEMADLTQFRPAWLTDTHDLRITRWPEPDITAYRALYSAVGDGWRWRDRLIMADEALRAALHSPNCSVYVLTTGSERAGYYELERQGEQTEIAYFGLAPAFHGRGLGKHLLSAAVQRAWADGARRLWVHTCNLDAPAALENYIRRGFVIYQTTEEPMPERYKTGSG